MYNTKLNDTLTLINIKIIVQICEVVCFHRNAMVRLLSNGSTFAKLNYNINNNNNIESTYYHSFVSSFNFNLLTALKSSTCNQSFRETRHVESPTYHVTNEPTIRVLGSRSVLIWHFHVLKPLREPAKA